MRQPTWTKTYITLAAFHEHILDFPLSHSPSSLTLKSPLPHTLTMTEKLQVAVAGIGRMGKSFSPMELSSI